MLKKAAWLVLPIVLGSLSIWLSSVRGGEAASGQADLSLKDLPALWSKSSDGFKGDRFIRAASTLQAMGKERAIRNLKALANSVKRHEDEQIFVLCRMLFSAKRGATFRRPSIGAASFIGGTTSATEADYKNWPLEPIEIVSGVPFLIAYGYHGAGHPESSSGYLDYCCENCDWNPYQFKPKTAAEMKATLNSFLSLPKVKGKLRDSEVEFLEAQIK
jgi:hypothetical protein